MQTHKVKTKWQATRLQEYWDRQYQIKCEVKPVTQFSPNHYLVTTDSDHPTWREICDAFIAGIDS